MSDAQLYGTELSAADKLGALRDELHAQQFAQVTDVRRFVDEYASAHPAEFAGAGVVQAQAVAAGIYATLGLKALDRPGESAAVVTHVENLIRGRAHASNDSARWAIQHGANQVSMSSGQLVHEAEDLYMDGAGIDLRLRRIYKNQGFSNGPFGVNWDHNYNLWLREETSGPHLNLVRLDGAGQESLYTRHELHDYWVPPPGEHSVIADLAGSASGGIPDLPLPAAAVGCRYALRMLHGEHCFYTQDPVFPKQFLIRCIADRFGNQLVFDSEAGSDGGLRISRVWVNSTYRWVALIYDSHDRINLLSDHAGRTWHYDYDGHGDLQSATTPPVGDYRAGLTRRYIYSTPTRSGELQHNLTGVYDTADRLFLENEFGETPGLLSFNRVVRQREGHGESSFEYQDVQLAMPAGPWNAEVEDLPAHQTIMVRRNGHPVHHIHNAAGNLIAREEDTFRSGSRRRLVTHYRYNRDGALVGQVSPEGRITEMLNGRDQFVRQHVLTDASEAQLRRQPALRWEERMAFGNRLTVLQRGTRLQRFHGFQFPSPLSALGGAQPDTDVVIKHTYDRRLQFLSSVSHPRYTTSALPGGPDENDPLYQAALTRFDYDAGTGKRLERIRYPDCTRNQQPELVNIEERFLTHDSQGRLASFVDRAGTLSRFDYFAAGDAREGYLRRRLVDPPDPANPDGVGLATTYEVNNVGVINGLTTPKGTRTGVDVDTLNRVTKVTRHLPPRTVPDPVTGVPHLKPSVTYSTRFKYCRNLRVERVERDIQDDEGQALSGGIEVQRIHYNENDQIARQSLGGLDPAGGLVTRFTYDDGDLRVRTTLPRGNHIRVHYDERRLPLRIVRGAGGEEAVTDTLKHDGDALIVEHTDGRGLITRFKHDGLGNPYETRSFDDQEQLIRLVRHDHDKSGNLVNERVFAPSGVSGWSLLQHVSFEYDELDQLIERRVRLLKAPISYALHAVNNASDFVPATDAARTVNHYDNAGRLIRVEQRGRRLDEFGARETSETTIASHYEYNAVGWLIAETDALCNRVETHYDAHGLVVRLDLREQASGSPTGEEVFTTLYEYDALDRLTAVVDSLGNRTHSEYDSRDALIRRIDPLGNVKHLVYDMQGRLQHERVEMPETGLGNGPRSPASDIVTSYEHDANGNRVRMTDANGASTSQQFDALDRRTALEFPGGATAQFQYDGKDNVVWMKDPNGLIRRTTYDPLDNPVDIAVDRTGLSASLTVGGVDREKFRYDAAGNLVQAYAEETSGNWWSELQLEYDSLGRPYQESMRCSASAETLTLLRDYDDLGFLRRVRYPGGRTVLSHPDALNRVARVESRDPGADYPGNPSAPANQTILDNRYAGFRLEQRRYGNGSETHYAYDGAARLIEIEHLSAAQTLLLRLQHLYDAAGNMRYRHCFQSVGGPGDGERYSYDAQQQLTRHQPVSIPSPFKATAFAPRKDAPPNPPQLSGQAYINGEIGSLAQQQSALSWHYDKLGNRQRETPPAGGPPITYGSNTLGQYTSRDGTSYRYDANGNLLDERQGGAALHEYVYDHRNRLVRTVAGSRQLSLHYDALGRCVLRRAPGDTTLFVHDDTNVVQERRVISSGQASRRYADYLYDAGPDARCCMAVAGHDYWYHTDIVGSTVLLTDSQGTLANDANGVPARYEYTPFGVLQSVPELPNRYWFTGRYYDDIAAAYDLRNRHYRPDTGAFMQRDPEEYDASMNLYLYASNSPVSATDRFGMSPEDEVRKVFVKGLQKRGIHFSEEVPIRVKAGKQWVRGRADLIYKDPFTGRFKVVEFKGTSLAPSGFTSGQRGYIPALAEGAQWEVIGRPWVKSTATGAFDVGLDVGFQQQGGLFKLKTLKAKLMAVFKENVFDAIGLVPARQIQFRGSSYQALAPTVFKRVQGAALAAGGKVKGVVPLVVGLITEDIMQSKATEDFVRRYQYTRATLSQLDTEFEASIGFHFAGWQTDPLNPSREVAKWQFQPTGRHRLVMGTYYIMNMFMSHHPVLYMMQEFPGYYSGKEKLFVPSSA